MKRVILTVGTRGSGKSTYCQKVIEAQPHVHLLSRDDFFIKEFGKCSFDPYTGDIHCANQIFWEYVQKTLTETQGIFILDYWTGWVGQRKEVIAKLYGFGVDAVEAWYFNTSKEDCIRQFLHRERHNGYGRSSAEHDWNLFHENIGDIFPPEDDGPEQTPNCELDPTFYLDIPRFHFDRIYLISPHQLTFPGMPLV